MTINDYTNACDDAARAAAERLGLTHTITGAAGSGIYCLPIERGLTVTITYIGRKPKGDDFIPVHGLSVAHHSSRVPSTAFAFPLSQVGLKAAKKLRAALLALPIDWTMALAELASLTESQRAEIAATCEAAFVAFGEARLVLWRGREATPPAPIPATPLRIYVCTATGWEVFADDLSAGDDLLALLREPHRPADGSGRVPRFGETRFACTLGYSDLRTPRGAEQWSAELPRLTGPYSRIAVDSDTTALDFGTIDTPRGLERVVLLLPDPSAWCRRVEALLAEIDEAERVAEQGRRAPNYRTIYGTWSKGPRSGSIRWPGRLTKAERSEREREQTEGDAARALAARSLARLKELADDSVRVASEMRGDRTWSENASSLRPNLIEHIEQLLTVKSRVAALLPYPECQSFAHELDWMRDEIADRKREAAALPDSLARFGLAPGERCRVLPAPWDVREGIGEREGVVLSASVELGETTVGRFPTIEHARKIRCDDGAIVNAYAAIECEVDTGAVRRCVKEPTP